MVVGREQPRPRTEEPELRLPPATIAHEELGGLAQRRELEGELGERVEETVREEGTIAPCS
jgi:hypothetical protein